MFAITAVDAADNLYNQANTGSFVDFSAPGVGRGKSALGEIGGAGEGGRRQVREQRTGRGDESAGRRGPKDRGLIDTLINGISLNG